MQPAGDVEQPFLGSFQATVIAAAVGKDAGRQCVEADRLRLRLGQGEIGECAGEAAIAVVERVQSDEPQMGDAGTQQRVQRGVGARAANQSRKAASWASRPSRGGASKWTVGRSSLPETTCIGSSPRSAPMRMRVGSRLSCSANSQRCHCSRRGRSSGASAWPVASSISSASPSLRPVVRRGLSSARPRWRASEERTEPTSSRSPSMAEEVTMLESRVSSASAACWSPATAPAMPSSWPWACWQSRSRAARASACQWKRGQSGCCQIQRGRSSVVWLGIGEPIGWVNWLFG